MPVIVIGADTPVGDRIVRALVGPRREVRAFVSDPAAATRLKGLGVKVATGDLSDAFHVEAACTDCFSAVLVTAAVGDGRELAFAGSVEAVAGWAGAVATAGVRRAIWVSATEPPPTDTPETARVDPTMDDREVAARVVELDGAATLDRNG